MQSRSPGTPGRGPNRTIQKWRLGPAGNVGRGPEHAIQNARLQFPQERPAGDPGGTQTIQMPFIRQETPAEDPNRDFKLPSRPPGKRAGDGTRKGRFKCRLFGQERRQSTRGIAHRDRPTNSRACGTPGQPTTTHWEAEPNKPHWLTLSQHLRHAPAAGADTPVSARVPMPGHAAATQSTQPPKR